jgi:O-antigen ligase
MTLVAILDVIVVVVLCASVVLRGFERTLPVAAFLLILFPDASQLHLAGLFDLTTQRVLVSVLLVLYVFSGRKARKGSASGKLPLKYLVLAQVAWMIVSTANSAVFTISFKAVLSQLFDYYLPFYIFAKSISEVKTVRNILLAFVAAMFVCSLFGAMEAYRGWSILSIFPATTNHFSNLVNAVADRGTRVQATFGHPILFGGALAIAIPLALYLVTTAKSWLGKTFLWSAVVLMFVDIYKTGSRGPWMALAFSLLALLVLGQGQLKKQVAVIGLLAVTVLVARPGVWETIYNDYVATNSSGTAQGESYQWRYALYGIAFQHLNADPARALWGYGPESFFYLGWKGDFQGKIVPFESCDSSIVQLMVETGYIGLLLVMAIFLKSVIKTYQHFRRMPKPSNSLCLVLLINICAFLFLMTNVAIFGWGQQTYMLWVIIALAMIYPGLVQTEQVVQEQATLAPAAFQHSFARSSRS